MPSGKLASYLLDILFFFSFFLLLITVELMLKGPQFISELLVESVLVCKESPREGQQNGEAARKSAYEVKSKEVSAFNVSETD